MDILSFSPDAVLDLENQGFPLTHEVRQVIVPRLFPDDDPAPQLSWEDMVLGVRLMSQTCTNRQARVSYKSKVELRFSNLQIIHPSSQKTIFPVIITDYFDFFPPRT